MKSHLIITFSLLVCFMASQVAGSQVHRCVDESGMVTFGYTPCPVTVKPEAAGNDKITVEDRMDSIGTLDAEIAGIQRQFRELRMDLEARIRALEDVEEKRTARHEYELQTGELLELLSQLREDRGALVNDAVKLLTDDGNS